MPTSRDFSRISRDVTMVESLRRPNSGKFPWRENTAASWPWYPEDLARAFDFPYQRLELRDFGVPSESSGPVARRHVAVGAGALQGAMQGGTYLNPLAPEIGNVIEIAP